MFDPLGIAARSIKECILIQAKTKCNGEFPIVAIIVNQYFQDLGNKRFAEIAQKLHLSVDHVKAISKMIATLEPKPARRFRPVDSNVYVKPDISIVPDIDGGFQIIINQDDIPPLRINRSYRKL